MPFKDPEAKKEYMRKYRQENAEAYKEYQRKWQRKWYQENKEAVKERNRKWREENKEADKERKRKRYQENKEAEKERSSKYRKENAEARKETMRNWQRKNLDKCRALTAKRKASKLQRTPYWLTEDEHWLIKEAYTLAKLREKATGIKWHVDHLVPLRGEIVSGLHVPWNFQVIPEAVNISKHNKWNWDEQR